MLIEIKARNMIATNPTMSSEDLLLLEPDSIENIKVILSATAETYPHRKKTRRGKKKSYVERMGDDFLASPTTDAENVSCGFHLTTPYSRQCEGGNVSNISPIRRKNKLRPAYSPKAPHNSTQFLMDDNLENQSLSENLFLQEEICIYENDHLPKESVASSPSIFSTTSAESSPCHVDVTCSENLSESMSLEEDYSSLEDIDSRINYFEQDFESIYCKMRAEELSKMSKQELVDSVLKLKSKLEKFERNEPEDDTKSSGVSLNSPSLITLVEENRHLQLENECLKKEVPL